VVGDEPDQDGQGHRVLLGKAQRQARPGPEITQVALIRAARVVGGPGVEDLADAFLCFGVEDGNLSGAAMMISDMFSLLACVR